MSQPDDRLIHAWLDGQANDADIADMDRLLQDDPAFAARFARLARLDYGCWRAQQLQARPSISSSLRQALATPPSRAGRAARPGAGRRRRRSPARPRRAQGAWLSGAGVAAAAVVLLLAGGWWFWPLPLAPTGTIVGHLDGSQAEILRDGRTSLRLDGDAPLLAGTRLRMPADGRIVLGQAIALDLRQGSELTLPQHDSSSGPSSPLVRLHQGELQAQVDGVPLVVETADLRVRVTGTAFTVHRDQARTLVSVREGQVQVTRVRDQAQTTLYAGMRLSSSDDFAAAASTPAAPLFSLSASTPTPAGMTINGPQRDAAFHSLVSQEQQWQVSRLSINRQQPPLFRHDRALAVVLEVTPPPDMQAVQIVLVMKEPGSEEHRGNLVAKMPIDASRGRQRIRVPLSALAAQRDLPNPPPGGDAVALIIEDHGCSTPFALHDLQVVSAAPPTP